MDQSIREDSIIRIQAARLTIHNYAQSHTFRIGARNLRRNRRTLWLQALLLELRCETVHVLILKKFLSVCFFFRCLQPLTRRANSNDYVSLAQFKELHLPRTLIAELPVRGIIERESVFVKVFDVWILAHRAGNEEKRSGQVNQ